MKVDKEFLQLCLTECINEYNGEYGSIKHQGFYVKKFNVDKVEGHFSWKELDTLYIVFRGSSSLRDWLSNLQFWKEDVKTSKPYGNINSDVEIHNGFIEQYKLVRDIIHNKIKEMTPKKIIVTGHSLGGALATICSVDCQYNFSDIQISCATFGSPRVGNDAFVKSFNKRVHDSIRVVNEDDLVCKVPMSYLGYEHVRDKLQIGEKHWYSILGSTNDHYPKHYKKNLKKLKE